MKEKARGGKELTRVKMLHFQKRSGESIYVLSHEEEKCVCLGWGECGGGLVRTAV